MQNHLLKQVPYTNCTWIMSLLLHENLFTISFLQSFRISHVNCLMNKTNCINYVIIRELDKLNYNPLPKVQMKT